MAQYITTQETKWYTTSGNVGGEFGPGKKFDSSRTVNRRRNIDGTNMWVPESACKVFVETPTDPPVEEKEMLQVRHSYDGGETWENWKEYEAC